jgi:hypothetical protein
MGKGLIVTFGILGALALLAVFFISGYFGFSNQCNQYENNIKAQYSENQNVYDNGWKKVVEIAQVPQQQMAAMKDLYMGMISGRYGQDGSKAMFQMMKEANPNVDQSTYTKVQQTIEEFHNKFEQRQSEMVERTRQYQNYITASTEGRLWNSFLRYPKIDMVKYTTVVTSDQTQQTFTDKKAGPLDVFGTGAKK